MRRRRPTGRSAVGVVAEAAVAIASVIDRDAAPLERKRMAF
jgi:hypothetical protein